MTNTHHSRGFGSTWSRRASTIRFAAHEARPEIAVGLLGVPVSLLGAPAAWQQVLGVGVSLGYCAAGILRKRALETFERTHSATSMDIEVRRAKHGNVVELSRRITVTVHLATKQIDGGRLKWHGTGNVMDHLRAMDPVGYRVQAHPAGDGAYDLEYVLDEWAQRNDELSLGFKIELPQSQPWNEPFLTTDLTTLDLTPWAPVRMRHTWDATTRLNPGDLLAYEYVSRQAYERKRAPHRLHFDELPDGHGVELSLSQREARFCFFGHRHRVPAPI